MSRPPGKGSFVMWEPVCWSISGKRADMLICLSSLSCLHVLLKSSPSLETPSFSFLPPQRDPQTFMRLELGIFLFPRTLGKRHREALVTWCPGPAWCRLQAWTVRVMNEVHQH